MDLLSGGPWGGNGGGREADQTDLPSWLKSLATTQETIRTVELTKLPEIKEGELGSLVVGDWIALISQPNDAGFERKQFKVVGRSAQSNYGSLL